MQEADIHARLASLEAQNRRIKRAGVLVLLVVGAAAIAGAAAEDPETVEAKTFVLRGENGKKRAVLGTYADQASLRMYGPEGRERLSLHVNAMGTSTISLTGGTDRGGIIIRVGGKTGQPRLTFQTPDGSSTFYATLRKDGHPMLWLWNAAEDPKGRYSMELTDHGIAFGVREERPTWVAPPGRFGGSGPLYSMRPVKKTE